MAEPDVNLTCYFLFTGEVKNGRVERAGWCVSSILGM